MIEIEVSGGSARLIGSEALTAGRTGLLCRAVFDSAWDGLQKTAVFSGARDADVLIRRETFGVPAQCLSKAGKSLRVGFYGTDGLGGIVIPTVWVNCGEIMTGAEPSGMSEQEMTPSLAAQIMGAAAEASAAVSRLLADADSGRFNGPKGDPGENGEPGAAGADGADGSDGVTFTPSVSSAGVLSWINDGERQNPASVDLVSAVLAALPTWEGGSF